jgi:hypothetical protein
MFYQMINLLALVAAIALLAVLIKIFYLVVQ